MIKTKMIRRTYEISKEMITVVKYSSYGRTYNNVNECLADITEHDTFNLTKMINDKIPDYIFKSIKPTPDFRKCLDAIEMNSFIRTNRKARAPIIRQIEKKLSYLF